MKRKIYEDLLKWKNTESKIPLMVVGARQIGKTYIINEFCKKEFKKFFKCNSLSNENTEEFDSGGIIVGYFQGI